MQCANLVLDPNDKAGAVILRGGTALAAEDEKRVAFEALSWML